MNQSDTQYSKLCSNVSKCCFSKHCSKPSIALLETRLYRLGLIFLKHLSMVCFVVTKKVCSISPWNFADDECIFLTETFQSLPIGSAKKVHSKTHGLVHSWILTCFSVTRQIRERQDIKSSNMTFYDSFWLQSSI